MIWLQIHRYKLCVPQLEGSEEVTAEGKGSVEVEKRKERRVTGDRSEEIGEPRPELKMGTNISPPSAIMIKIVRLHLRLPASHFLLQLLDASPYLHLSLQAHGSKGPSPPLLHPAPSSCCLHFLLPTPRSESPQRRRNRKIQRTRSTWGRRRRRRPK